MKKKLEFTKENQLLYKNNTDYYFLSYYILVTYQN